MAPVVWITILLSAFAAAKDPYLLVVEKTEVSRVSLDGQTVTSVIDGLASPVNVAADFSAGYLFVTDSGCQCIVRAKLDGTEKVTVVDNLDTPYGIALDPDTLKIYWSDTGTRTIGSCDYNGGNCRNPLVSGLEKPSGLLVYIMDRGASWLFWVDSQAETIGRIGLDGTNEEKNFINTGLTVGSTPEMIAYDPATMTVYWSDTSQRKIFSIEIAAQLPPPTELVSGVTQIKGLVVFDGFVYYTELFGQRIMKVAVDTGATEELKGGLSLPRGLALVNPQGGGDIGDLAGAPFLRMTLGRVNAVIFICTIPETANVSEYRVIWRTGAKELFTINVPGPIATLEIDNEEGVKKGIQNSMACEVEVRKFVDGKVVIDPKIAKSNVITPEIYVKTLAINVIEGAPPQEIEIVVTGPPMFWQVNAFFLESSLLREPEELRDERDEVIAQIVIAAQPGTFSAKKLITGLNWFEKHVFKAKAKQDGKVETQKTAVRTLQILRTVPEDGGAGLLRKKREDDPGEVVGEVECSVTDNDDHACCQGVNDPHMRAFDGEYYEMHLVGEFVLFRHVFPDLLPIQLNFVTQKCYPNTYVTCICAVYLRVEDDVWVFHKCVTEQVLSVADQAKQPLHVFLIGDRDTDNNGNPLVSITPSNNGATHTMELPGDRKLTVSIDWVFLSFHFQVIVDDQTLTTGLCGLYDKVMTNDLKDRGGTVHDDPGRPLGPVQFSESWRVREGESLLGGVVPGQVRDPDLDVIYCSVLDTQTNEVCGKFMNMVLPQMNKVKPNIAPDIAAKQRFPRQTHAVKFVPAGAKRRKRSVTDDTGFNPFAAIVGDVNDSTTYNPPTWPTPSGRTEAEVTTFCSDAINSHAGIQLCKTAMGVDFQQYIDQCIVDILVLDDLRWVDDAIAAVKQICALFVEKSDNSAADGAPPPPLPNGVSRDALMAAICLNDCSGNGVCSKGACQCSGDYVGADCSMKVTDPPEVTFLFETFCDVGVRSCAEAIIYGQKFHNRETLTCHIQEYTLGDPLPVGSSVSVKAEFTKFDQIACPVPTRRPYVIQVSNDGVNMAPTKRLFAPVNASCYECGMISLDDIPSAGCSPKPGTCVIDGQCYMDLAVNSADSCKVCDPSASRDAWTTTKGEGCSGMTDSTLVIILCATFGSLLVIGVLAGVIFLCVRESMFVKKAKAGP